MVRIHSGHRPIARVPDYEFQLVSDHGPAADAANGTNSMTAPYPVGITRRHFPETDRFTGLFSDEGFIGHMLLCRIVWLSSPTRERVSWGAQWTPVRSVSRPGMCRDRGPREELTVGAVLCTLELPGSEASDMDVELVQPGLHAVDRELNLEL